MCYSLSFLVWPLEVVVWAGANEQDWDSASEKMVVGSQQVAGSKFEVIR